METSQKLLKEEDILQEEAKAAAEFAALPFFDTFRKFEKVVVLECSFIKMTKNTLGTLEAQTLLFQRTPKVYAVFYHVS